MALAASLGGATISERADQGHWRAGNVTVHARKAAGGGPWRAASPAAQAARSGTSCSSQESANATALTRHATRNTQCIDPEKAAR